jgi:hypothetical protein
MTIASAQAVAMEILWLWAIAFGFRLTIRILRA